MAWDRQKCDIPGLCYGTSDLNLYLCVNIICKRTFPAEFMLFILAFVTLIFYLKY